MDFNRDKNQEKRGRKWRKKDRYIKMLNWEEICPSRVLGVIIHHMFFQKYGRIDFYKFSGKKQKQNSTSLAFQKKKKRSVKATG